MMNKVICSFIIQLLQIILGNNSETANKKITTELTFHLKGIYVSKQLLLLICSSNLHVSNYILLFFFI